MRCSKPCDKAVRRVEGWTWKPPGGERSIIGCARKGATGWRRPGGCAVLRQVYWVGEKVSRLLDQLAWARADGSCGQRRTERVVEFVGIGWAPVVPDQVRRASAVRRLAHPE